MVKDKYEIELVEIKTKLNRLVIGQIRRRPTIEDIKWAKMRRKLFVELTAK